MVHGSPASRFELDPLFLRWSRRYQLHHEMRLPDIPAWHRLIARHDANPGWFDLRHPQIGRWIEQQESIRIPNSPRLDPPPHVISGTGSQLHHEMRNIGRWIEQQEPVRIPNSPRLDPPPLVSSGAEFVEWAVSATPIGEPSGPSTVPEPSSLILLSVAMLAIWFLSLLMGRRSRTCRM
jgi:hypothetical protein